jgi:hypothetical protein
MSIYQQPLSLLRNVRDILTTEYRDLDLASLAALELSASEASALGPRVAQMLQDLEPHLTAFGDALGAMQGYVRRQKVYASAFYGTAVALIVVVAGLAVYAAYMTSVTAIERGMPLHERALRYMFIMIAVAVVVWLLSLVAAIMKDRMARVVNLKTNELDRFRINLANNVFVRFAAAYAAGPQAVKDFDRRVFEEVRVSAEEALLDTGDLCTSASNGGQGGGTLRSVLSARCMISTLCEGSANKTYEGVVTDKLREASKAKYFEFTAEEAEDVLRASGDPKDAAWADNDPCRGTLRELFRTLLEVRTGGVFHTTDQFVMWNQISQGVDVLRETVVRTAADAGAAAIKSDRVLEILEREVVAPMKLDFMAVEDLAPHADHKEGVVTTAASTRGSCWAACYERGPGCRWAFHDASAGQCSVAVGDAVPGVASAVLAKVAAPADVPAAGSSAAMMVHAPAKKSKSLALIGGSLSDAQLRRSFRSMVYSGSLSLGRCAQDEACDLATAPASLAGGGDAAVAGAFTAERGSAAGAGDYKAAFPGGGSDGSTEDLRPKARLLLATPDQIRAANGADLPRLVVATFTELVPSVRDRVAAALDKYQYRIPLATYRAQILKSLEAHYGASVFEALKPLLGALLATLESVNKAGRRRLATGNRKPDFVNPTVFDVRWSQLSSEQRARVVDAAGTLGVVTEAYQKKYPADPSMLPVTFTRTLASFAVVVSVAAIMATALIQYRHVAERSKSLGDACRMMLFAGSVIILIDALILSSYKQYAAGREFDNRVRDKNGLAMVQRARRLASLLTTVPGFRYRATVKTSEGATFHVVRRGEAKDADVLDSAATSDGRGIFLSDSSAKSTKDVDIGEPVELRLTLVDAPASSGQGPQIVDVRSVDLYLSDRGVTYRFAGASATAAASSAPAVLPLAGEAPTGSMGVARVAAPKAADEGFSDALKADFANSGAIRVTAVPRAQRPEGLYAVTKSVVEMFDKCNNLSSRLRQVPFPWAEVVMWALALAALAGAGVYVLLLLDPWGRVKNIRTLMAVRDKVLSEERAPEFDYVVKCCRASSVAVRHLLTVGVVVLAVATLVVAALINNNDVSGLVKSMYGSTRYATGTCSG